MAAEAARFDGASEQFADHYGQVRGYIRGKVTQHNLTDWLPSGGALQVLDFGGGEGHDAIWLAGMGDEVTLLDESPEMVAQAMAVIKRQEPEIRRRVRIEQGGLEQIGSRAYGLVLSHGVLMYELDDPIGQLRTLSSRLRPGGVLSLLTKGYEAARAKSDNPAKAGRFNENGEYVNRLGLPTRVYRFSELEAMMGEVGLRTVAKYGVRILHDDDRRDVTGVPPSELGDIVAREVVASRDPARMEQAQMLHIIAKHL
jgi:S-adenosylmethionine-dependent methyltransferase